MRVGIARQVGRAWFPYRWLGLLMVALALLGAMVADSVRRPAPTAAQAPRGLPPINAVYFADASQPGIDPQQARARGVRVVGSARELVAEAATADVVVIDRDVLPGLDPQWLPMQLAQGRAIVALNVSRDQLHELTGYARRDASWRDSAATQGPPFFSLVYQRRGQGEERGGTGSDLIRDPFYFFQTLYLLTPAGQADVKSRGPAQPAPPAGPVQHRP